MILSSTKGQFSVFGIYSSKRGRNLAGWHKSGWSELNNVFSYDSHLIS